MDIGMARVRSANQRKFAERRNPPMPLSERTCFKCGLKGHIARECKKAAVNVNSVIATNFKASSLDSDHSLSMVFGIVNGQAARLVVDSGATNTVLSKRFVEDANIEVQPTDVTITLADGSTIAPIGKTARLGINVQGVSYAVDAIITDMKHDVLLGSDWLKGVGAIIDLARKRMIVPEKVIHIVDDTRDADTLKELLHEDIGVLSAEVDLDLPL